jgi:tetratricopeptide (TPR) repeat protein
MARFWLDRARSDDAGREEREKWIKNAQHYFVRAWKLDDTKPEVYALYGQTFLDYGNRPEKAVEMLQEAASLLPSNLEIRYHLALAHRRAGNASQALSLARSIAGSGHAGPAYGPKSLDLMRELTEQCTPMLYSAFANELHLKTYLSFVESAKEPAVGNALITLTFEKNGRAKDIEIKRSSSDEFGDLAIEAIRSWAPFNKKSSMGFQCFSGKAYTFGFEVDETAFCGNKEQNRYERRIYKSILKALHTDEMMSQPGSGRVQLTFWLNEEGGIRRRSVGQQEGQPAGAKLERVIDSIGPFGPPPGAAGCWSGPVWQSFDVLGSDADTHL